MKIFHLSDLHLGKRINGYSMLDDQRFILEKILDAAREEAPQAVLIAGDIYDKATPSEESVALLDDFLYRLAGLSGKPQVFVIYGNHDSAERLAFGNRLMAESGVHLASVFHGSLEPALLSDAYGEVAFYLLPFLRPSDARNAYPDVKIETHTDAVREALRHAVLVPERRNVLVAHQFVTDSLRSASEDLPVGGLDNVDSCVFDGFDYVALGHLHRPQAVPGKGNIRYCGTPLKYSLSEKDDVKGILVVEMGAKGHIAYRRIPLKPLHDMREIQGTYEELSLRKNYEGTDTADYIHAVLTDENDVVDAIGRLRVIYPNLLSLEYRNRRTAAIQEIVTLEKQEKKSDLEILSELYLQQNNQELNTEQRALAEEIFQAIQEGKE